MQLVPVQTESPERSAFACPMHPEVTDSKPGDMSEVRDETGAFGRGSHTEKNRSWLAFTEHEVDGLEWEDLMPEINRASDPSNMFWKVIDRESGSENGAIKWAFTVGDRVKIRLVNEMESDHPMHHPFHIHGAGRFLVLSRDAEPESNLVWKDTVLVRAGQEVDILLDVSNPGPLDGALSHRRTRPERDDVQLRCRSCERVTEAEFGLPV